MTIELTQQQAFIARLMLTKDEALKKMVKHIRSGAGLALADNNYLTRDNAEELLAAYDAKYRVIEADVLRDFITISLDLRAKIVALDSPFRAFDPEAREIDEKLGHLINRAREVLDEGTQKPEAPITCTRCKDTHMVHDSRYEHKIMCTSCPRPCPNCQMDRQGPYCKTVPCKCACHASGGAR